MKKNNKKGFTLVELMAVVLVLIIIVFIAINKVNKSTKEARDKTLLANAGVYIKAVNSYISVEAIDNEYLENVKLSLGLIKNNIKINGTKPNTGNFTIEDSEVKEACLEYNGFKVTYSNGNFSDIMKGVCEDSSSFDYAYTGDVQVFTAPMTSTYKIELWGASGSTNDLGGKGAYVSGDIELKSGDTLNIYVGGQSTGFNATFNGGGGCTNHCTAGGGATDVRLISGNWDDQTSLASRIIVAAGGAGYNAYNSGYRGGPGGALTGITGAGDSPTTGGTQISAGVSYGNDATKNGFFGKGGFGDDWGGGGAGGYYGGAGGRNSSTGNGGSSGSSFISGHVGCVAIKSKTEIMPKDGCLDGTTDIECSKHYSGLYFTNTIMKSGDEEMPTYDGNSTMIGNSGNGYAKITIIE